MRRNSCENFKVIQGHLLKLLKIKRGQEGGDGKLIPLSLRETFEFNKFENGAEKYFSVQD